MVDGTLYLSTPTNRVIALDAATGAERWVYDPKLDLTVELLGGDLARRRDVGRPRQAARRARLPAALRRHASTARLIALDAATGRPVEDFGQRGAIDLTPGARRAVRGRRVPGDLAARGDRRPRGRRLADRRQPRRRDARAASCAPSTRAPARCAGAGTRSRGSPDDPRLPDVDGAARPPDGRRQRLAARSPSIRSATWSSCRRRRRAPTTTAASGKGRQPLRQLRRRAARRRPGKLVWHFQTVHHDLWDYDVPMQPLAVRPSTRGGATVPARAHRHQDRAPLRAPPRDGRAALPGRGAAACPQTDVPGEETSPTQPFPSTLPVFGLRRVTAEDAWGPTPADLETAPRADRRAPLRGALHAGRACGAASRRPATSAASTGAGSATTPRGARRGRRNRLRRRRPALPARRRRRAGVGPNVPARGASSARCGTRRT